MKTDIYLHIGGSIDAWEQLENTPTFVALPKNIQEEIANQVYNLLYEVKFTLSVDDKLNVSLKGVEL